MVILHRGNNNNRKVIIMINNNKQLLNHTYNEINIYKWRDKGGNFIEPKNMDTKHIFFIIRMIWNHFMPKDAIIKPYNRYRFGEYYTEEYFKTSLINLFKELNTRNDLKPYFVKCINFMKDYINNNEILKLDIK